MREMNQQTSEWECRNREGEVSAARKSIMDEEAYRIASKFSEFRQGTTYETRHLFAQVSRASLGRREDLKSRKI